TLYVDCPYAGGTVCLSAGSYTMAQLQALGMGNDQLSSVKVAAGNTVKLYDGDNYTGTLVTLTADSQCLTDPAINFNDRTTSVIVEGSGGQQTPPPPPPPAPPQGSSEYCGGAPLKNGHSTWYNLVEPLVNCSYETGSLPPYYG